MHDKFIVKLFSSFPFSIWINHILQNLVFLRCNLLETGTLAVNLQGQVDGLDVIIVSFSSHHPDY